ncbi:hypothetical protein PTTG_00870 [Puccinia triticina 1-1 BBBD Race 1]|uniref:Uncharacterized protein n=1 Tax=Puccinia triticina (isolate 1-1 / race 1 (BBBD)) TaxID=630390 RepID=A0A0C4EJF2_PUCT1|nr:hypothetical protein PTTG_00870 [Puccinia triticina 1-1 BBBD Race 1]
METTGPMGSGRFGATNASGPSSAIIRPASGPARPPLEAVRLQNYVKTKKPDPLAKAAFAKLIKENPSAGAFKLKLGKQAATEQDDDATFEGVTDIHPSFQNSNRLSYHQKTLLAELGIVPGKNGAGSGDDFILKMFNWALQGLFIISSSYLPGMEHFMFQSKWMSERLLARNKNGEVYHARLFSLKILIKPLILNILQDPFPLLSLYALFHVSWS